ncbi:MAG: COX15/CtaA family protein [Alphaproteobacteria bacterium]
MANIGAITRLTESGLSIVEWKPITGALPPLSTKAWEQEFSLYQQSPEYRTHNRGMSLAEFKNIYFWEYLHRLWGRLIGIAFLIPFLGFLVAGRMPRNLIAPLIAIFVLGGLEGGVGWWMVKSGLIHDPRVSPYRLATHLGLATLIYSTLLMMGLRCAWATPPHQPTARAHRWRRWSFILAGLVFLTLLAGALVAGLDAGMVYNTFPLMNGDIVPPDLFVLRPLWRNFFENPTTAQFDHRLLALVSFTAILLFILRLRQEPLPTRALWAWRCIAFLVTIQVILGIATLLLQVPVLLASLHQLGAFLLLGTRLIGGETLRSILHNP